ncbi:MAG: S41 family peptidase [bacterium]|nr:S41 family peptidase [bacterium]
MNNPSRRIIFIILVTALLGVGFYSGAQFEKFKTSRSAENIAKEIVNKTVDKPASIDFGLFWSVLNKLEEKFVDQDKLANKRNLVYGAIQGMVNSAGDPYTVFLEPVESKKFEEQISGSFGGIGIEIGMRNNLLTVITPVKGTPAEKAGILTGDIIIKIDDKDATTLRIDEAVSQIRGKKGTAVKLSIQRTGLKELKNFSIVRDDIKVPTVDWKLIDGNIAHLQIFGFNRTTETDFNRAAKEILSSKADRIILDLRNNPGGILDSAVNIASWFLDPNQTVVTERFADGTETALRTNKSAELKKYPIVVLINNGSASASEILAGALRDNRGVKLIGETSFGKGSVQELVEFQTEAGKATLKVTIAKWFTPSGVSINDNGIKPDIEIKRTEEDINKNLDPQLEKAKEAIK